MNELIQTFKFEGSNLRVIVENGEPWFCAIDVCKALGYSNTRDALRNHTKNKGVAKHDTPTKGGVQPLAYLNEGNLYRLIMRSKLESAERFQDWVCGEVLPTIRKTGPYGTRQTPALPDFTNPAIAARAWAEQYEQRLALEAQVKSDMPKVEFAEAVTASDAEHTITEAAKVLSIRPRKFFDWLRMGGFIYKQGTQAMQISINKGLMVTRFHTFKHTDGELDKKAHARITGKGLYFFYQRLRHEGLIERNPNLELTA